MDFAFKTIHQFNEFFKDEAACYAYLEEQLWAGVPVCPHCASAKKPYNVKARSKKAGFDTIPSYRCSEKECQLPFTVRTASIFEGSKVELRKWFQAVYEITVAKNGISSVELGNRIGVSQKTAWFINHRLRSMLIEAKPELLTGVVEVDETYIGGSWTNKHKSVRKLSKTDRLITKTNKTGVIALLSRDNNVRTVVLDGTKTFKEIVRENVCTGSFIVTDNCKQYRGLDKEYVSHEVVNHSLDEFVRGPWYTNSVEGFFGQLKRGIKGTHIYVSPQHIHRYATEFATRYNGRKISNIERFINIVKNSGVERVTYKVLTASPAPLRMS
jgi:hypothetical protein